MTIPDRAAYSALGTEEKEALLRRLAGEVGAKWKGMAAFSRWGQSTETGLFDWKGHRFVFVPGGPVTLGWEDFTDTPEAAAFHRALDEDVREYWGGQYTAREIIGLLTSQVREAVLPPMLVEQAAGDFEDSQPVQWEDLTLSEGWQKAVDDFRGSGRGRFLELDTFQPGNPKLRVTRNKDGSLSPEIILPATAEDLQKRLEGEGFSLPTADQWEYFCGGGCRTLFPWGDSLSGCGGRERDRKPNFFGLTIAYEPYKREVVRESPWPFRGGDGGEMECYGTLNVLNDFVCSPYFVGWYGREWTEEMEELLADGLSGRYDCYRRVLVLD